MDGIINVNKPLGITSHDVVYRLRKILGIKKIGHTGTLDPDAEGVLPMCIGRGTKLAEVLTAKEKPVGDALAGKIIVITGTLPTMSRDEAKKLIVAHGGKASSSVSKKTDYLLCGADAGSKLAEAQRLGTPVITEDELKKMLGL